ncbi:MAG: Rne/Rng family ribonuclease [Clostridia bacterium]|nr:Rne/Rng family ribonuclease [Clostridia bacterium]
MKEIYIKQENDAKKIYLIEDRVILEKHEESIENPMLEGNIYIGKVQNVLPGMQAAFINIGSGKNAFIHLKDLLPKIDVTKEPESKNKDIRKIIKPGDPVLVQVTRDKNYKKGARVTTHISLTGRFFVYMPNSPFIAVSQKIENEERKQELKELVTKILPKDTGGIIRTNCDKAKKEDILEDIKKLVEIWNGLIDGEFTQYPKEIYNNGGIIKKYIIDNLDKNLDKIVVCDKNVEKVVKDILNCENKKIKLEINDKYLEQYDYENQIRKLENRKIWLDCGGFITIDKTEALTAIDVNSGKYIGKSNFEDTIYIVNKEATIEIARQLRARDIGGIIIIDYIDMHIEKNKEDIVQLMEQEIKKDGSKVQIEGFTKLNLLEMTRKHVYSS